MRRRGIGTMLMAFAEAEARAAGRTLLVLDALRGTPAEALYHALGYRSAGTIPNYALFPDGAMGDTTIFYKEV
jgi:ribosomal protein S18 acetylase RimI-like enzyme